MHAIFSDNCDVIQLCDIIGHMTIRLSIEMISYYVVNKNQTQTRISLSFHDFM